MSWKIQNGIQIPFETVTWKILTRLVEYSDDNCPRKYTGANRTKRVSWYGLTAYNKWTNAEVKTDHIFGMPWDLNRDPLDWKPTSLVTWSSPAFAEHFGSWNMSSVSPIVWPTHKVTKLKQNEIFESRVVAELANASIICSRDPGSNFGIYKNLLWFVLMFEVLVCLVSLSCLTQNITRQNNLFIYSIYDIYLMSFWP
jgi:hypothetical protein